MPRSANKPRRICFVTGTRAEFGLMRTTLQAIKAHPALQLQIIATGMHLSARHGQSRRQISAEGFTIDRIIPWCASRAGSAQLAAATGTATAGLARVFEQLESDIVLIVGDRVEAFAAAAAANLSGRPVAHVHGGDRALGQIDDALRHAITKLAHIHFPATADSAQRIRRLGEQPWRIRTVGSPGNDQITSQATPRRELRTRYPQLRRGQYALLLLHPVDDNESAEHARAAMLLRAARQAGFPRIVIVYPNNDPGHGGIIRCWDEHASDPDLTVFRNVPRADFLGLLRDAAVLAGNSSSGIIESGSLATMTLDIGPRQQGRQRSGNVLHCQYGFRPIITRLRRIWHGGEPLRWHGKNVYAGNGAGRRIAAHLASVKIDPRLLKKLISY